MHGTVHNGDTQGIVGHIACGQQRTSCIWWNRFHWRHKLPSEEEADRCNCRHPPNQSVHSKDSLLPQSLRHNSGTCSFQVVMSCNEIEAMYHLELWRVGRDAPSCDEGALTIRAPLYLFMTNPNRKKCRVVFMLRLYIWVLLFLLISQSS